MTGLTFNEALQWLLTLGLATASTFVTGALIRLVQDRTGHPMTTVAKQYTAYAIPFLLVAGAYAGRVYFGYVAFSVDTAFAYFLNAGTVAFSSQLLYTAYQTTKKPELLEPGPVPPEPDVPL